QALDAPGDPAPSAPAAPAAAPSATPTPSSAPAGETAAPAAKRSAPRVASGSTTVAGRLPPEVIQRIVRQNTGRFRLCYQKGLENNPNLQGRVTVRFVIAADGSVSSASNGGSDLPDATVISCIVRAFNGLSFPQPEGGIVTVSYPLMFSPGG